MRVYCLIIYFYKKGTEVGFGSGDGCFHHNPPTKEDVFEVQKKIKEMYSFDNVVILNWLPLSKDTVEDKKQM